ncbi:MAG: hypothetical protein M1823_002356 [Watsoniomyces obsoletus]|nr:MAG: hypothetical protein M1823_002356 [Watsoniomyces obsoletus]
MVRYLYLETPTQRALLVPRLAHRNQAEMTRFIVKFKRKPTLAMIKNRMKKQQGSPEGESHQQEDSPDGEESQHDHAPDGEYEANIGRW